MFLDCEFAESFINSRLTRSECAAFLGVNVSTLRRWLNNKTKPPKSALEAMRMLSGYTPRLAKRGKAFHGWRFIDGMLFTDEGMGFTPAQIRSIWHVDQLLKGQAREIKELKAEIVAFESENRNELPSNVIPFPIRSGGLVA